MFLSLGDFQFDSNLKTSVAWDKLNECYSKTVPKLLQHLAWIFLMKPVPLVALSIRSVQLDCSILTITVQPHSNGTFKELVLFQLVADFRKTEGLITSALLSKVTSYAFAVDKRFCQQCWIRLAHSLKILVSKASHALQVAFWERVNGFVLMYAQSSRQGNPKN